MYGGYSRGCYPRGGYGPRGCYMGRCGPPFRRPFYPMGRGMMMGMDMAMMTTMMTCTMMTTMMMASRPRYYYPPVYRRPPTVIIINNQPRCYPVS